MIMEKRYYWMKFRSDFFESKRIKKLCSMGAIYLMIYMKMQLKSLPTDGVLEFTGIENDFAHEVALDINEKPAYVQKTVDFLLENGLLVKVDENTFLLPWVPENVGSETAGTQRVRDFRKRKALHCNADVTDMKRECNADETKLKRECNVEREKEKEIDIELYIEREKERDFLPPTFEEVKARCEEKGYDRVDPWLFISYYDANGWKIGKTPMVNWESALDVWAMREMRRPAKKNSGYANRTVRMDDIKDIIVNLNEEADK